MPSPAVSLRPLHRKSAFASGERAEISRENGGRCLPTVGFFFEVTHCKEYVWDRMGGFGENIKRLGVEWNFFSAVWDAKCQAHPND